MTAAAESAPIPVKIRILDKEFTVGCEPDEKAALLEAAAALDSKMRAIRGVNRMAAMDRVMLLAALNFVSEFHALQKAQSRRETELSDVVRTLADKLDTLQPDPAV